VLHLQTFVLFVALIASQVFADSGQSSPMEQVCTHTRASG
jgi:hypothetical protein